MNTTASSDWAEKQAHTILDEFTPLPEWEYEKRHEILVKNLLAAAKVPEGCVRVDLTLAERGLLIGFLKDYSEKLGNAGCNDFTMADTPENRAIVTAAQGKDQNISLTAGNIITFDWQIVDYLAAKIEAATSVAAGEVK